MIFGFHASDPRLQREYRSGGGYCVAGGSFLSLAVCQGLLFRWVRVLIGVLGVQMVNGLDGHAAGSCYN